MNTHITSPPFYRKIVGLGTGLITVGLGVGLITVGLGTGLIIVGLSRSFLQRIVIHIVYKHVQRVCLHAYVLFVCMCIQCRSSVDSTYIFSEHAEFFGLSSLCPLSKRLRRETGSTPG